MKKLNKNEIKCLLFTALLTLIIAIPFALVYIVLMLQYSEITWQFWLISYFYMLLFLVLIAFSDVIHTKLKANYGEVILTKKEYLNLFKKNLFGNFSICFLIVFTVIYLDQLSKTIVLNNLLLHEKVVGIPYIINFYFVYNTGAAWSMLSEHTQLLGWISLFASFVILYFLKDFNIFKKPLYSIALSFILGGTIGNMIDRFFSSKGVIDFLDFAFMDYPTFNIADSFLVIGTICLAVYVLLDLIKDIKTKKTKVEDEL